MPLQALAHDAPAKSRSVGYGDVGIGHAEDALLNEKQDLLVEGSLQTVGRMARKGLVQSDRLLADRRVERQGASDDCLRRLRTTDHFDERDDVGRIEGVADDAA